MLSPCLARFQIHLGQWITSDVPQLPLDALQLPQRQLHLLASILRLPQNLCFMLFPPCIFPMILTP